MAKFLNRLKRSWLKRFGSDRQILEQLYLDRHGVPADLDHPRTFNEKIQWYKLFYRHPLMPGFADKYRVREHLTQIGLGQILNELHGVYASTAEIDFAALPDAFVLKATHGSGMNIICKDKRQLDREQCRRKLDRWLQTDFYRPGREWCYKGIPRRIVCEKFLVNEEYNELLDYKIYCFGGKPHTIFVCSGRFGPEGLKCQCFDPDWRPLDIRKGHGRARLHLPRPRQLDEMLAIASRLAGDFPFIRVDFYLVQERIIFGELTFYPDSGLDPFDPPEHNLRYGDFFVLPAKYSP